MSKSWLIFIVPFCSVFMLMGGKLMLTSVREMALGMHARNWPHTTGQILGFEYRDTSTPDGKSREIVIRYRYKVSGLNYEGKIIHPAYRSSSVERTHRDLDLVLRDAREVRVFYSETQPERSMLVVGFYSCSLVPFLGGAVSFAVGLGLLLLCWFAFAGGQDFARAIQVIH